MNAFKQTKRMLAMLLALVMLVGMMPVHAFAAQSNEPIVLLGGGDYQQAGDHSGSSANVTDILEQIVDAGITAVDGFLFIGDYDCETHDSSSETSSGIASLMSTVSGVYSNLDYDNTILVQGNHDYADSRIDSTGGHDFDGYSVFVMNEDDYPNGGGSESQAKALAAKLDSFLAEKLAQGFTAPIFVTSHVPLHFGPRTNRQGDGKYAGYIFDVLNSYGAEGLNLIFMHGHNHAYGYDEYLGGEAIYLAVGDQINIAKNGSQSSYNTYTLNFTYMNAGYTGYYNESGYSTSSGTDFLTMTTFEIYGDRVVIGRYNANGIYNLKTAGESKGDYINSVSVSPNTTKYASTQTVMLTAPAERVTLEDAATGITVTGIKVEGTFDDNSDLTVSGPLTLDILENAAKCAQYRAYNVSFVSEGNASVTMPLPEGFSKNTTKLFLVSGNALTEVEATISSESVSFLAAAGGTYALVQETAEGDGSVYYQRVDSVSDLVSGSEYLIVFDCSSQTTSDAIVMPTIATYSSGSSKRMGPDVLVSDGLGDEDTISGDYDQYLWTLTKSGNGWLIGNGSQNINVTYSSTTSRCELAFTDSGEALTIATASSNPSDADSNSFAIYDSSSYYWQYNTSATLIYGTNGDSYSSRFHFYERVEQTASEPELDKGWVSLPSNGTYVLDTDGMDPGARYIVVGNSNDYALTVSNGTVSQSKVTISNNTISVDDPSVYEFWFESNSAESGTYLLTQDGGNTVYHANGSMYYGSDNKGYWYVTTGSNGTYKVYDYDNLNWYLNYGYVWSSESVSRFAVSSNTRYVRLFKSTSSVYGDTYIRLAGQTQQNCAAGTTVDQVLANVYIQVTEDGYSISDTVSVTADMVSWDKSFDGNTSGTYTGTVTYENVVLGDITVTINAHTHNYTSETVEPTCTENGSIVYTCECGDTYSEVIAALGHNYQAVVTAPSCTEEGFTTYTCECGDSYVADYVDATGHTYTSVTVEPTCTEDGSIVYTCACGDTYTEVIEAVGHNYQAVVTAPTCTEDGYTTYTCECGDSYVADHVEATGHTYTSVTVEPTCAEDGSIVYTCECGDTYSEVIEAVGHNYQAVVTAPTCTEDGFTTYTCNCGDSYAADYTDATGHTYTSVTVEPTCTEGGYTETACTICGDVTITNETDALGHSYETEVVAPTCETAGYTTYTCHCGDSYIADEVAALGHDFQSVVTEATCVTDGYTTHTCATCSTVTVDTIVEALGHDWQTVTVDATCTEDGSVTATCDRCGETNAEVIPALGHNYESAYTAPTCTEDGSIIYTCACGDAYSEVIDALGHNYEGIVTTPTCTEDGFTTYTCACGDTYVADEVDALGHNYEAVVTAPTCTEGGCTTYTCDCGDTYVADEVDALGHNYEAVVTAPTCTEGGYTTYTCDCGDTYVADEVDALGHDYASVVTAPTCTEEGFTTYTCACGVTYIADEVDALGHSYESVVTAPTCTEEGFTTYTCACGDTYVADEVDALGHNYESVVTAPTCTDEGYTTYTCVCGDTYVADEVAALGHNYESVITAPTCTEDGFTTYTCACGDTYVADEVAALGHSYTAVESDGYMVYTCACGDSYSEKIANSYTQVSSIASGNNYVITLYSGSTYYALSHANNTVSVVKVTVSNGEITSEITDDLLWTYSDSKLSYVSNGTTYYMYAGSSSNNWWGNWWGNMWGSSTLSLSSSNSSTVSFSSSKLKVGSSYYLRYSNGSVSLNRSATTTYFFVEG